MKPFGTWLRERRAEIGRSLRQAALEAACSDAWLCQVETGHVHPHGLRLGSLRLLAQAYMLSVRDIYERAVNVEAPEKPAARTRRLRCVDAESPVALRIKKVDVRTSKKTQ